MLKGQKSAALSWKICKKHIKNILKKSENLYES